LQWEKAGVVEVADIVVIHKADLPGAEQTAAHLRSALDLPGGRPIPLHLISAKSKSGLEALWSSIMACPRRRDVNHHDSKSTEPG
jgi:putative protein kinase ArgK-like GTPase of G3E family